MNRGEGVGKYAKYAARTRTHVCFKGRVGCQPVRERMFALKHVLVASQYANACSPRGHKWATAGHRARCGPLWPACGPLWPAVARLWPLMAPCGPFVFYGRTFEKFSRGPLCGPPGHRATRNFSKVRISRFFHFSADGRRFRKRRESIILSFLLLVDRRPKNEKKTKNPNL